MDISHPFAEDSPASVYKELKDGERAILSAAEGLVTLVEDEVRAHEKYEEEKNDLLKKMFDEEAEGSVKKRTELQRQAIYRSRYGKDRLEWQLKKRDVEAH
jgi:hypothetical protein